MNFEKLGIIVDKECKTLNSKIQENPNLFKFFCFEITYPRNVPVFSLSTKTLQESSNSKYINDDNENSSIQNETQNEKVNFKKILNIYELLIHIFDYCDGFSLICNLRVCRKWNIILSNNILKRIFIVIINIFRIG